MLETPKKYYSPDNKDGYDIKHNKHNDNIEQTKQDIILNLQQRNWNTVATITNQHKLSQKILESPEIKNAAKQSIAYLLKEMNIDTALKIKNNLNLSQEDVADIVKQELINRLTSYGNEQYAIELTKAFNPSNKVLNSPEVAEAVKQGLINRLSYGYKPDNAIAIKKAFNPSKEILNSPEVIGAIKQGLINCLLLDYVQDAIEIKEVFNLSQEILNEVIKQWLINYLLYSQVQNVIDLKKAFNPAQEILNSPEVMEAIKQGLIQRLSLGYAQDAIKIKEAFNPSKEILNSPEVIYAIKQGLINCLTQGHKQDAIRIKEVFNPSQKIFNEAIKQGLINCLTQGSVQEAIEIKETFNPSNAILNDAVKQGLINCLTQGHTQDAIKIKEAFNPSQKILNEVIKPELINYLLYGREYDVIEIKKAFNPSQKILKSPEVIDAIKQGLINRLSQGYVQETIKIKEAFNPSKEILNSPEVIDAVKQRLINRLSDVSDGHVQEAIEIKKTFNPSNAILHDAVKQGLINCLTQGHTQDAIKIKEAFNPSQEIFDEAIKQGFINCLTQGHEQDAIRIKEVFNPSQEIFDEAIKQGFINCLIQGHTQDAIKIRESFNLPQETFDEVVTQGLINCLTQGNVQEAIRIKEAFNPSNAIFNEAVKQGLINCLTQGNVQEAIKIKETFNPTQEILNSTDIDKAIKQSLINCLSQGNVQDAIEIKKTFNPSQEIFDEVIKNTMYKEHSIMLYKILNKKPLTEQEAKDFVNIHKENNTPTFGTYSQWLISGGEYFSYKNILEYVGYNHKSLHDRLYLIDKIIEIAEQSGLSAQQFYQNIMYEVKLDDANYEDIDSYTYFNNIVENINIQSIPNILKQAKQYPYVAKMQELLSVLGKRESIFDSWKNLKKYYEVTQLLNKTELLNKLKTIQETKPKQYKYFETLLFHPNINTGAVVELFENPSAFFDTEEIHEPLSHKLIKPSNYFKMANLDLNAEDLRDAIIDGSLDKIQSFEPLEIDIEIPNLKVSRENILEALGSKKNNIPGKATNPKKLFNQLNTALKDKNINLIKFLQDTEKIDDSLIDIIAPILFNKEYGLKNEYQKFKAKINLKSDPDAIVAGNDTTCCMKFGSGKNNVYTANPMCALFTVQKLNTDGKWRTIAQSVLTKDIDIQTSVSKIIQKIKNVNEALNDIVPENILINSQKYITCDNIEVAPNFNNQENQHTLSEIYSKFFYEYLKSINNIELNKDKLIVGPGYSDAFTSFPKIENTFLPITPVGYSDNISDMSIVFDIKNIPDIKINIKKPEVEKDDTLKISGLSPGISSLTYEDSLQVGYLESKVYSDNKSLIANLHNMENELIAKDINNVSKNRHNLSLKYIDNNKTMQGYMLAYEGKYDGKPIIYIADLVSTRTNPMIGGKLVMEFINLYKHYYSDKNNLIPILAQARETTGYLLIKNGLNNFSKKLKKNVSVHELKTYQVGKDTMHTMLIQISELQSQ